MEKVNENKTGIDAILHKLDRIFKSSKSEPVEEEKDPIFKTDDEEVVEQEETTEDVADEVAAEDEETDPADKELEKSEDEEEYEEEYEEELEEQEEEIEYDALVDRIYEEVSESIMSMVDARLNELEDILNGVLDNQNKQTQAIENTVDQYEKSLKENTDLRKSLNAVNKKLSNIQSARKSIIDINTRERFEEPKVNKIDTLSKSEKASILADLLEQGSTAVTVRDVTNMELGAPISEKAERALNKAINK